jgi:hypothetical protein
MIFADLDGTILNALICPYEKTLLAIDYLKEINIP